MKYENISEIKEYFENLKIDKSPHTIRAYSTSINLLLDFTGAENFSDVIKITPQDLRSFQRKLKEGGSEMSTINSRMRPIRAMFNWLVLNEYLESTPASKVKDLKTPKKMINFLSEEEIVSMINASDNIRDRLIIALLVATGIRRNELISLKVNDFDGKHIIINGKGSKQRKLMIQEDVSKLMYQWISIRNKKYGGINDYLFVSNHKTKFDGDSILEKVKSTMRKANFTDERIQQIHTHSLRHTFVANLFESGADIYVAKNALGHENLSTTTLYSHLRNTAMDKAMGNMKSFIKG
jgi:site-specific recombinase XerD